MSSINVHIVTYNSAATITACLQAVQAQSVPCQIRVYDNASSDDTVQQVQALGVPITVGAVNLGYAAAHNRLLADCPADYVLTLNPDLTLAPQFLQAMRAALEADAGLGSAAGRLLRVDDLNADGVLIDSAGVFMRRNRRQGLRGENQPAADFDQPCAIFGPDGAAAFYRLAMLRDIAVDGQIFDEDFFMHKEDIDVCWRAQLAGWRSAYVPDAHGKHIRTFRPGHQQRGRVGDDLRWVAVRNRYLLAIKNEVGRGLLADLLPMLSYDVLIWGYILLREPRSLRALPSLVRLLPSLLHKRRSIQARRRVTWADLRGFFRGVPT